MPAFVSESTMATRAAEASVRKSASFESALGGNWLSFVSDGRLHRTGVDVVDGGADLDVDADSRHRRTALAAIDARHLSECDPVSVPGAHRPWARLFRRGGCNQSSSQFTITDLA